MNENLKKNYISNSIRYRSIQKTLYHYLSNSMAIPMKLLLSEDPIRMFDHQTYPVQSQVKFMIDMFSQTGTASLLYVNDAKVLIDIIIRYLTDLQPGDKVRAHYRNQSSEYSGTCIYNDNKTHSFWQFSKNCKMGMPSVFFFSIFFSPFVPPLCLLFIHLFLVLSLSLSLFIFISFSLPLCIWTFLVSSIFCLFISHWLLQ